MLRSPLLSMLTLSLLAAAVACGPGPDPSAGDGFAADAAGDTSLADSVIAWAEEIRERIGPLPAQVGSDPGAARQRAVELYVTRQERIEQAVGPGTGSPAELAESVHEAEARFHELMQLLGSSPPPDSTAVAGAVQALDARLAEVVDLAGAAEPRSTMPATGGAAGDPERGLIERLDAVRAGLADIERALADAGPDRAGALALRLYLDEFEVIEGWWGPGGSYATPELAARVSEGEAAFHVLLGADGDALPAAVAEIRHALDPIEREARRPGIVLVPVQAAAPSAVGPVEVPAAETPEIAALVAELERGRNAYADGRPDPALAAVEHAYLEGFEPLESRLPSGLTGRIERAIHLSLRPAIRSGAPSEEIDAAFGSLYADLVLADQQLSGGASFWFGAVNAFAIIFREGLEAVLLVGAMLAYLGRMENARRHQRQVYAGVVAGVAASIATWMVASTLVPVSGANRELVEGVTALIAVAVLLYVSHWLFQKTYIHDWKAYLEQHLGRAVTRGSAFAMAGLAFAAVYREGFETVLFYQALMFDAGAAAVLAGFVPGIVVIAAIGYGIVRLGLRLPLKRVFAVTGSVLLYLAFVFLGKGVYNLQEAGLFTPRPLPWVPDHEALRQLLGLYPLAETLLAQAAFLVLLSAGAIWYRASRSRAPAPAEPAPAEPAPAGPRSPHAEPIETR